VSEWLPDAEKDVARHYLYRLTHQRRKLTALVLEKAENFVTPILEILQRRGLPAALACLPLVESAFEPHAVSPAGAAGLWQLMPQTARRYGLLVNKDLDERFDSVKSTEAAAAYLGDLYSQFGDWSLALTAYNCGEGALLKAMAKTGAESLPDLFEARRRRKEPDFVLPEETMNFVPQFVAAVTVMSGVRSFPPISGDIRMLHCPPLRPAGGRIALPPVTAAAPRVEEPPLLPAGQYAGTTETQQQPARSIRIQSW
jgi:membrane-bound lytic murein transglycosylase D